MDIRGRSITLRSSRAFFRSAGNEVAKTAYRQQYGGSNAYFYNIVVASIAPMLIVWGAALGMDAALVAAIGGDSLLAGTNGARQT